MDQLQSLLKPVRDEDGRLERVAGEELVASSAINHQNTGAESQRSDLNISISSEAKKAEVELERDDNKEVETI
jgi:hypothetical protein